MDRFKPVSPSSPNMMMYTFALVPAPLTSPVTTDTSYVLMRAAEETQDRQHYIWTTGHVTLDMKRRIGNITYEPQYK